MGYILKTNGGKVYTGRADELWVSAHAETAFEYNTREGATHKCEILNRGTCLHGYVFRVVAEG